MANILDYLDWRGDLSFQQYPFSQVDALILSRLSYVPFDGIVSEKPEDAPVPLSEAAKQCLALVHDAGSARRFRMDDDEALLKKLIDSPRFNALRLAAYANVFSEQLSEQFSATTILMPDDEAFVSYRGTDGTIIGWKEDFSLAFADVVPAQRDAVAYLTRIAESFPGKLRIGGHSKGGNLAVYAAAFCAPDIQRRILAVTNHDGPGFNEKIVADARFSGMMDRVHTILPQSSVIGMLLEHEEDFSIVHSTNTGILQHDVYSWEIARNHFISVEALTNSSRYIDRTLKDWVANMQPAQREKMIDGIFSVLGTSDAVSFHELLSGKNTIAVVRAISGMDDETRDILKQTFSILGASAKDALKDMIRQRSQEYPAVERLLSLVENSAAAAPSK